MSELRKFASGYILCKDQTLFCETAKLQMYEATETAMESQRTWQLAGFYRTVVNILVPYEVLGPAADPPWLAGLIFNSN